MALSIIQINIYLILNIYPIRNRLQTTNNKQQTTNVYKYNSLHTLILLWVFVKTNIAS